MNQDYEFPIFSNPAPECKALDVACLQLAITDIFEVFAQDKLLKGVNFISSISDRHPNSSIYVHCKASRTRSATLVGCYLIEKYGISPEEAVSLMTEKRSRVLLRSKNWKALRNFQANVSLTETKNKVNKRLK